MVKRKISIAIFSVITLALLSTVALAVVSTGVWQNGSNAITIVKGNSATFDVAVFSVSPPATYTISIYHSNGTLMSVLRNNVQDADGWYTERINVTPADYGGIGGVFSVVINAADNAGDTSYTLLTLTVTQQAPVLSSLPDVSINAGDTLQVFDLDDYVSDADDSYASLGWSVNGSNENVSATISAGNVVTIFANSSFTGTHTLTFTVVDPSGASDSDSITVTVFPAGTILTSDSDGDVTIHSLNFEVVDGSYLLIRNKGSNLDDLRVSLQVEASGSDEQVWNMDLNRNTVTYKLLNLEGIESGTYLARLEVSSGDDDFEESAYLVAEL